MRNNLDMSFFRAIFSIFSFYNILVMACPQIDAVQNSLSTTQLAVSAPHN